MRVDLNEIQFFARVAEERSFTQAARRLRVPKSTVSRAVRRLEERLGVRLVERTTRRVSLTEVGAMYLNHCRRVMEEAEEADRSVGNLLARPRGLLRVGVPAPFARYVLAPILGEFLALYPELQVDIQLLNSSAFPLDLNLDILVYSGSAGDSDWLVRWLMRVRQGIYASPEFLSRHGRPETPAGLRGLPCVTTSCDLVGGEPAGSVTWRLQRGGEVTEVKMEARVAVADPAINHQLTLAGAGIAALSQGMVRDDVEAGRLVRLLPEWDLDPIEVYAYYPSRLSASPKVRALLEFLKERTPAKE
ncbi:MAG TPA: LysR substrate-binding domain-containing protein [Acidobacteriaceae bacterium]|jgi:DNA-binding transcriptional LysR family regulator|nr:LysR substrate-binding domain-containing protein [Acidobacteriaceae bacterium]